MDEMRLGAKSVVLRDQGGMDVEMRGLESRRLHCSLSGMWLFAKACIHVPFSLI